MILLTHQHAAGDEADTGDESGQWQYLDPAGRTIGDYSAEKLLAWATKGYFSGGLQVLPWFNLRVACTHRAHTSSHPTLSAQTLG